MLTASGWSSCAALPASPFISAGSGAATPFDSKISSRSYEEALEYLRDYLRRHPNAPDAAAVQTTIRNLSVK